MNFSTQHITNTPPKYGSALTNSALANIVEVTSDNASESTANKTKPSVLNFPNLKDKYRPGWICNVSQHFAFSRVYNEYLQIGANAQYTQFEIVCQLLKSNTCRVIYFDDNFTSVQLATIRKLQSNSRTELFNAKMAYLFADKISSFSA